MGFLSGVLEAVKDENEVTTYDNYISGDDKKLNKVIEKLNTKIGSGRAGLAESVEQVREWLEGYGNTLWSMTHNVTNELGKLKDEKINEYIKFVADKQGDKLETQLATWTSVLGSISDAVQTVETNVNMLDSRLRNDVMHEMKVVSKSVQVLRESAGNSDMTRQAAYVDEQLEKQKEHMVYAVNTQSKIAIDSIENVFTNIFKKIGDLKNTKETKFGDIRYAVNTTRELTDICIRNFDVGIKDKIAQTYAAIKHELDCVYRELTAKGVQLADLIRQARETFKTIQTDVADAHMGLDGNIPHEWGVLKIEIVDLVNKVKGEGETRRGRNDDGISQIKEAVQKHAKGFEVFGNKIKDWVSDIIANNEVVKEKLGSYVEENRKRGLKKDYHDGTNAIVKAFSEMIAQKIRDHLEEAILTDSFQSLSRVGLSSGSIDGNLRMIQDVCNSFAGMLEVQLKTYKGRIPAIVTHAVQIAAKIESEVRDTPLLSSSNPDSHLRSAVATTLNVLPTSARQSATSVQRFATASDLQNKLTKIAANVDKIKEQFDASPKSAYDDTHGDKIDKALQRVSAAIKTLGTLLSIPEKQGEINKKLDDIRSELEKLDEIKKDDEKGGTINKKKKEADDRIDHLKNQLVSIQTDVNLIIRNVRNADKALDTASNELLQFLVESETACKQAVSQLQTTLLEEVRKAFRNVTNDVRVLFANAHIADLQALQTSITEQKESISRIIKSDRNNSVKGLLKWLYKNKGKKLEEINDVVKQPAEQPQEHSKKFKKLSAKFEEYVDKLFDYIEYQVKTPKGDNTLDKLGNEQSGHVRTVKSNMDTLLNHLKINANKMYNFDDVFKTVLSNLINAVTSPSPLLGPLKAGICAFAQQLGHAYVNRYSGKRSEGELVVKKQPPKDQKVAINPSSDTSLDNYVLTPEGRNCAKVCLTIVEMVMDDLKYLRDQCKTKWTSKTIYSGSSLGSFLSDCGYRVAIKETDQNGELQCKSSMNGEEIYRKLHERKLTGDDATTKHLKECESNEVIKKTQKKKQDNFDIFDLIKCLHHHLQKYYFVNHMATFTAKKQPCSVYEMLCWLSGLPHNDVYLDLTTDGFDALFDKRKNKEHDSTEFEYITVEDKTPNSLEAHPQKVTHGEITKAIMHVTSVSPMVLAAILGTGDADTTYAVDFRSNYLKFSYPTRAEDCLHTLLDILRRIFPPLKFLHSQCDTLPSEHGWYSCKYGRDVQSAKLPCRKHSKSEPDCQPKSPLMSFLGDCLPGHLPHHLSSVGCKAECKTCPKVTPGQPCLTPLGFRGFSGSTKLGKELGNVLTKFFNNGVASCLFSVIPKPPSNLSEHFGFALYLVRGWGEGSTRTGKNGIQNYIEDAVKSQSIDLYSDTTPLTNALTKAYGDARGNHQAKDHLPSYADVASLSMIKSCVDKVNQVYCAPYLTSVCGDSYGFFAKKHANLYLSWAIYLPWQFWSLLNDLYNAFCSINCQDWGCRGCLRGDKCKKGDHGSIHETTKKSNCQCRSIVDCKGVAPTLYQYGFVFGEASTLNDKQSPKKCSDFCSQLKKVLESQYFVKLFKECDNFLWIIRQPFTYMVLALWSLSLFYLICVMVGRLDVLHIRSHLRIPSSHKITAQSLLAAAQVRRLAKISYLQA